MAFASMPVDVDAATVPVEMESGSFAIMENDVDDVPWNDDLYIHAPENWVKLKQ